MAKDIKDPSGVYEGITYQYATDITWRKYNLYNKILYLLKGIFSSINILKKDPCDVVILYGDNLMVVNVLFRLFSKRAKVPLIGDRSELPSVKIRNSKLRSFVYSLKQRTCDGMIIMTRSLLNYYKQFYKNESLFFLPMTVDPNRFNGLNRQEQVDTEYIAVVFGTHNRDGLLESIVSYKRYCEKGGRYSLLLIGDYCSMPNRAALEEEIERFYDKDRIRILGRQPNDKVPQYLINASILLTTPNMYISGGFPTKLGEYMLSGVPIVATEAGELLDYVTPGEDLLMCKPGDFEAISDSLLKLENDKVLSGYLSVNAKKKARSLFCADSYVNDMESFFKRIIKKAQN
ncbi:MAG: glycosyltransferase family 4 protein [Bacteroidaceae bacterium]|nr:glycosyltransferase family 4 protein [Bacteroidaceae bacterium]